MENNKKTSRTIIIVLAILLVCAGFTIAFLLGRESKENHTINEGSISEKGTKNKEDGTTTTTSTTSTTKKKDSTTIVTNKAVKYSEKDKTVIEEVEKIDEATDLILSEEKGETAKSKLKGVFISLVDFLFYDGEIKGVTFDELTSAGKEKVLQIIHSIDEKIEKKFPGYKENISSTAKEAFIKASELIKKGAANIKDFSQNKLGEENYNRIIEAKDEFVEYTKAAYSIIKDIGGDFLSGTKDKIKDWYERFRES